MILKLIICRWARQSVTEIVLSKHEEILYENLIGVKSDHENLRNIYEPLPKSQGISNVVTKIYK